MYDNATRMYEITSFMYAEIHGFVFVFANVKKNPTIMRIIKVLLELRT